MPGRSAGVPAWRARLGVRVASRHQHRSRTESVRELAAETGLTDRFNRTFTPALSRSEATIFGCDSARSIRYKAPMSFADFPEQQQVVQVLQRSLERGRLAHAYLFTGASIDDLEAMSRTLAKTLNCQQPRKSEAGNALDSCDRCPICRRIGDGLHP